MRHDLARAAVVGALALAACAPSSPPAPSTNPSSLPSTGAEASAMANQQRNRETVRRVYDDVLNTGKLELLSDMVADEYIAPDGRRGPSAFGDIMAKLRTAFPDIRYTIDDLVAEGDRVAVRWTWQGTHLGPGPFGPQAATGKSVKNTGMAVFRLRDGKVVSIVTETDRLGFLQAIGVVPAGIGGGPAPAASAAANR